MEINSDDTETNTSDDNNIFAQFDYILVFDLEFSGPDFFKHGIVSIGAVLCAYNETNHIFYKEFYQECNLDKNQSFDPNTAEHFWKSTQDLNRLFEKIKAQKANPPQETMKSFVNFLKECYSISNGTMFICTNRVDIDCTWLNLYLCKYGFEPLHLLFGKMIRIIDTNSFHQGISQTLHYETLQDHSEFYSNYNANESAFKSLNIKRRPQTKYDHCSINDAKWLAEAHILILQKIMLRKRDYQFPKIDPLEEYKYAIQDNTVMPKKKTHNAVNISPQYNKPPSYFDQNFYLYQPSIFYTNPQQPYGIPPPPEFYYQSSFIPNTNSLRTTTQNTRNKNHVEPQMHPPPKNFVFKKEDFPHLNKK